MKIDIFYKNITSDAPLEFFINDKIGSLEKLIDNPEVFAKVEIGKPSEHHRSGDIFYAEANLMIGGNLFRATAEGSDLRDAIVEVKNELQTQIVKFKEKLIDAHHSGENSKE